MCKGKSLFFLRWKCFISTIQHLFHLLQYISVLLDSDLTNCKFGGELLVTLQSAEIQYKVEKLKISHSVLWTREVSVVI